MFGGKQHVGDKWMGSEMVALLSGECGTKTEGDDNDNYDSIWLLTSDEASEPIPTRISRASPCGVGLTVYLRSTEGANVIKVIRRRRQLPKRQALPTVLFPCCVCVLCHE